MGKTSKGQVRQTEILGAARTLLISDGLDGFVLRRIADQVGIKLGNLQHYYATRDDLLEALVRDEFRHDLNTLESPATTADTSTATFDSSTATQSGTESAAQAETQFLDSVRTLIERWGIDGGNVYMATGMLSVADERFAALCHEMYTSFYAVMTQHIHRLDPTATATDAHGRAILVTALIDGSSLQVYGTIGATTKDAMKDKFLAQALRIAKG